MRLPLLLAFLTSASIVCDARQPSELTSTLLSRSTAVIVAEFRDAGSTALSANYYVVDNFDVKATLAGSFPEETISLHIVRSLRDHPHPYKPGEKVILFVKKLPDAFPPWGLADDDFGVQPYTHGLEESIKQLLAR